MYSICNLYFLIKISHNHVNKKKRCNYIFEARNQIIGLCSILINQLIFFIYNCKKFFRKIFKINNATAKTQILVGDNICIPAVAPVPQSLSRGQVIQIIRAAWPDDLEEQAIAIAQRESRLNPRAVSSGKCCYGLFQIYYRWHKTWLPDVGVTTANQLLDAQLNAVAAYRMYQRNNGWGPWK